METALPSTAAPWVKEVRSQTAKRAVTHSIFNKVSSLATTNWYNVSHECPKEYVCTEQRLFTLLSTLDVYKSTGPDSISARMKQLQVSLYLSLDDPTFQDMYTISTVCQPVGLSPERSVAQWSMIYTLETRQRNTRSKASRNIVYYGRFQPFFLRNKFVHQADQRLWHTHARTYAHTFNIDSLHCAFHGRPGDWEGQCKHNVTAGAPIETALIMPTRWRSLVPRPLPPVGLR